MAGPITWRNVQATTDGSSRLLANATNAIGNSTNGLLQALGTYQKQADDAFKQTQVNNTQNFLDEVASYSPDQLADPNVQANLNAKRVALGNTLDRTAARAALPTAIAQAQQQQEATLKFNAAQRGEQQRPLVGQFYDLLAKGDTAGANTLLQNTNFDNEGRLLDDVNQYQDRVTNRGYAAKNEARAEDAQSRANRAFDLQERNSNQSYNFAKADQDMQVKQFNANMEDRATRNADFAVKAGNEYLQNDLKAHNSQVQAASKANPWVPDPKEDPITSSNDLLKDLPKGAFDAWVATDEGSRTNVQKKVNSLLVDGLKFKQDGVEYQVPLSKQMVSQALQATGNNTRVTDESFNRDIDGYFKSILNPYTQEGKHNRALAIQALDIKAQDAEYKKQFALKQQSLKPSALKNGAAIINTLNGIGGDKPTNPKYFSDEPD